MICFQERTSASGEDQHEVAGAAHAQRRVDRFLLVRDQRDRGLRDARGDERRRHDARHLVGRAVAQVVVAAADVVVEAARHGLRDRAQVLVAPVAGTGEHDDAPARDVEPLREIRHASPTACALWP